ncbi:hypothetical protein VTN49DRAFT_7309 [Thermomyces lanuginosus]|uniref:uncharacterized protein n=1 Tax=Thermomyces lanuginosus TaxID=5541 RepID=UPI003743BC13
MRLSLRLLCITLLCAGIAASPSTKIGPDFRSAGINIAKISSNKGGSPGPKYFHESSFNNHYDGRFGSEEMLEEKSLPYLRALIQTYLVTMKDLGVATWIMHGTLLGWWWNQKIMPWDADIDVQVTEPGIHFLAQYYNMTEHHFDLPGIPGGRTYVLDVNPNYNVSSTNDYDNVIDARWIDKTSGLYIDITAVRPDDKRREKGETGALICKDSHQYQEEDLFPLRDSLFEGVPVKIPFAFVKLLTDEYGKNSITGTRYNGYTFNEEAQLWIRDDVNDKLTKAQQYQRS